MSREKLPTRRKSRSFNFIHDERSYHASFSRYADGRLAETIAHAVKGHPLAVALELAVRP